MLRSGPRCHSLPWPFDQPCQTAERVPETKFRVGSHAGLTALALAILVCRLIGWSLPVGRPVGAINYHRYRGVGRATYSKEVRAVPILQLTPIMDPDHHLGHYDKAMHALH